MTRMNDSRLLDASTSDYNGSRRMTRLVGRPRNSYWGPSPTLEACLEEALGTLDSRVSWTQSESPMQESVVASPLDFFGGPTQTKAVASLPSLPLYPRS